LRRDVLPQARAGVVVSVRDDTSDDERQEGHERGEADEDADNHVPEIRFLVRLFGAPTLAAKEMAQVERGANEAHENEEDGRKSGVVAH